MRSQFGNNGGRGEYRGEQEGPRNGGMTQGYGGQGQGYMGQGYGPDRMQESQGGQWGQPSERTADRGGPRGRQDASEDHSARIVKVIEVLAESERGWEDAAQKAVAEAGRSVRNIRSVYIKDMQGIVENGRITHFRVNAKISFAIDDGRPRRD